MNNSMFTDDEIKEQLSNLGFKSIPRDKFEMFKKDLEKLISSETSFDTSNSLFENANKDRVNLKQPLQSRLNSKKVTFPDETTNSLTNKDGNSSDDENNQAESSFVSITTTSSIVDNKIMKRKIVRKSAMPVTKEKHKLSEENLNSQVKHLSLNGKNLVEIVSTEPVRSLKANARDLNLPDEDEMYEENQNNELDTSVEHQYYSDDENYFRLNDHYLPINYPVKSFIRSQSSISLKSDNSLNRNQANKTNPLKLFQEYKKVWNKHKTPGERDHKDLRWSIREQMLEKHKQQKIYVPNTYMIPTDKKRQQLRWVVRSTLANPV